MKVRLGPPASARARCTFCHADDGRLGACDGCGGWTHRECLQAHGGCPTLGCQRSLPTAPTAPAAPRDVPRPGRERRLARQRAREEIARQAALAALREQDVGAHRELAEAIFRHSAPERPSLGRRALLFARLGLSLTVHAASLVLLLGLVPWLLLRHPDVLARLVAEQGAINATILGLGTLYAIGFLAVSAASWLRAGAGVFMEVNELLRSTSPLPMRLVRLVHVRAPADAMLGPIGHGGQHESFPIGLLLSPSWLHLLRKEEVVLVYGRRPGGPRVLQRNDGGLALLHG